MSENTPLVNRPIVNKWFSTVIIMMGLLFAISKASVAFILGIQPNRAMATIIYSFE